MVDVGTFTTIGGLCLGGIVWAVRLEGKVTENKQVADGRYNQHVQLFIEREKQNLTQLGEMKLQLSRIEGKLDSIAYSSIKTV